MRVWICPTDCGLGMRSKTDLGLDFRSKTDLGLDFRSKTDSWLGIRSKTDLGPGMGLQRAKDKDKIKLLPHALSFCF